jgi:hypothetical protein
MKSTSKIRSGSRLPGGGGEITKYIPAVLAAGDFQRRKEKAMATEDHKSEPVQRRFYPPQQGPSGNILSDIAIRGVRDVFRKSITGAMKDGSLRAFLNEIGYDLVKRSKKKAKQKPRNKPLVEREAPKTKAASPKRPLRGKAN